MKRAPMVINASLVKQIVQEGTFETDVEPLVEESARCVRTNQQILITQIRV